MGHNDLDLATVARLDDVALMAGLQGLVQRDRALTARLLLHLGEVDARDHVSGRHEQDGVLGLHETEEPLLPIRQIDHPFDVVLGAFEPSEVLDGGDHVGRRTHHGPIAVVVLRSSPARRPSCW